VSYAYESQGNAPHAPFMQVLLINPIDKSQRITCKALLDTGACYTHVPLRFLRRIRVRVAGRAKSFIGFGGEKKSTPYVISVRLDEQSFETEVWSWDKDFVLVGRDLMNRYHIELDGPNLIFMFNY
jgi:predicted aspartyl protease